MWASEIGCGLFEYSIQYLNIDNREKEKILECEKEVQILKTAKIYTQCIFIASAHTSKSGHIIEIDVRHLYRHIEILIFIDESYGKC